MGYDEQKWAETAEYRLLPVNVSVTMLHTIHAKLYALYSSVKEEDWKRPYIHSQSKKQFDLWYLFGMYAWHWKTSCSAYNKFKGTKRLVRIVHN